MNIHRHSLLLVLSTLFYRAIVISSWSPTHKLSKQHLHSSAVQVQFPDPSIITIMSAKSTSSEDDNSGQVVAVQGSLLVSNMHKIGLSTDKSSKLRLLLASQSPRRREILDMMGLAGRYTAEPSPLNEEELQVELANKNFSPHDYARTLAERKAHAAIVMQSSNNDGEVTLIIGSDTIVDLNGLIMEKPKDEVDAFDMISRLSGNWHQVHTGVAVYAVGVGGGNDDDDDEKLMFSFTDTARVKFAALADEDIHSYIASKEPMDKAGSYGIQGIGGQLVERMEGDFFTVMGLPMHRLSRELSKAISSLGI